MLRPLVFALAMMLGTAGAKADDWDDCQSSENGDLKIRACSKLIKSKQTHKELRVHAFSLRGFAYYEQREFDRAIADLDKAIELDPKYAIPYFIRGISYWSKGWFDHAIPDFDKVIEIDPEHAGAYTSRGNAYDKKGEYDRAFADYAKAIEIDPKAAGA